MGDDGFWGRLFRREGDDCARGDVAFKKGVCSGLLRAPGAFCRGVPPRLTEDVCLPLENGMAGSSAENREGVAAIAGVPVLLFPSNMEIGTRSSNSDPRRGPDMSDLTHSSSPPILRARPLATRSPKPRPSFCRVRESSSREKALNRFGIKAGGIPGPVSTTLMTINRREVLLRAALSEILPHSVNLIAFRNTQEINFARSRSSTRFDQSVSEF